MDPFALDVAHMFAGGLVLVSFMLLYQDRMFSLLNIFALHAFVVSVSVAWQAHIQNAPHLYITAAIALVVKAILIPVVLHRIIVRLGIHRSVETVVGISQDPLFGPVVMVGLGGVFVEVLRDVTFRVPPFDADEAGRMVRELQAYPLLEGARGQKPADVDALVDVIMNVQRLAMDLAGDVRELDINPLVVRPRGAVALDALVVRT